MINGTKLKLREWFEIVYFIIVRLSGSRLCYWFKNVVVDYATGLKTFK